MQWSILEEKIYGNIGNGSVPGIARVPGRSRGAITNNILLDRSISKYRAFSGMSLTPSPPPPLPAI